MIETNTCDDFNTLCGSPIDLQYCTITTYNHAHTLILSKPAPPMTILLPAYSFILPNIVTICTVNGNNTQ